MASRVTASNSRAITSKPLLSIKATPKSNINNKGTKVKRVTITNSRDSHKIRLTFVSLTVTFRSQYNQNGEPQAAEGERGIGGAISGGLAGAVGGHQVGHGLLGALGGAILGSFTEDKLKQHHQKKSSDNLQGQQGQQGHHHGGGFSESFSENLNFGKRN